MSKEEIIFNWDNAGMLKGLEGIDKENVALAYEETAKIMLDSLENNENKNLTIEVIIFPLIRRVLTKNRDYVFNTEKFLELVSIYNSKPDSFFEEKDNKKLTKPK